MFGRRCNEAAHWKQSSVAFVMLHLNTWPQCINLVVEGLSTRTVDALVGVQTPVVKVVIGKNQIAHWRLVVNYVDIFNLPDPP